MNSETNMLVGRSEDRAVLHVPTILPQPQLQYGGEGKGLKRKAVKKWGRGGRISKL